MTKEREVVDKKREKKKKNREKKLKISTDAELVNDAPATKAVCQQWTQNIT